MINNMNDYRRDMRKREQERQRAALLRKIKRYSISNLMKYIVFGMGGVYLLDFFLAPALGNTLSYFLAFDLSAVLSGQVWRLITFVFYPPSTSIIFVFFALYFYWLVGSYMENHWGSFKFNLFYLCGMFGSLLGGLITGYATNFYINLSLFLAFAITYPNFEFLLFFVLPVKAKWLALIGGLPYLYMMIYNNWPNRIALLLSLLNIIIFLRGDIQQIINNMRRRAQWKRRNNNRY
jgi:hypothetical protein